MRGELKWLLIAAPVAIIPAAVSNELGVAAFGGFIVAAVAVLALAYRSETAEQRSPHDGLRFLALVLCSSVLVGGVYLLVMANGLTQRGPLNFVWMLGLPAILGWILRRRLMGLALGLPIALLGCFWFAALGFTFQIPVD